MKALYRWTAGLTCTLLPTNRSSSRMSSTLAPISNRSESPVLFAKHGRGIVAWIGDMGNRNPQLLLWPCAICIAMKGFEESANGRLSLVVDLRFTFTSALASTGARHV